MRLYDDPVEVRKGPLRSIEGGGVGEEGPEQFLWKGRLWQVREVIAHWIETGNWFDHLDLGVPGSSQAVDSQTGDLLQEREVWRVSAAQGRLVSDPGFGVFDLSFNWSAGEWRLARTAD